MTAEQLDTSVPQAARIWNYWLGGRDNFAVDRQVGDEIRQALPQIVDNAGFFAGLELIEPGVTSAPLRRPESGDAQPLDGVGGVARKR